MSTIYTDDQYDTCYPPGIDNHWWTIARGAQVLRIVRGENRFGDVFLEVGCGRGIEVKALRNAGIDVYGVELADVRPLEGVEPFISSGIDAIQLPLVERERVTGLLLLDVIEHQPLSSRRLNLASRNSRWSSLRFQLRRNYGRTTMCSTVTIVVTRPKCL